MKKCPTCEKTFDDSLKFCQADGTPLIDDAPPPDPYATMVGNKADFQIPPKVETPKEPAEAAPEIVESQVVPEDVLEVPEDEDIDLMKTMVAGKKTAGSIKVDLPDGDLDLGSDELKPESKPPMPEPPKFSEPDVSPPDFTGVLDEPAEKKSEKSGEKAATPPPSPFSAPKDDDSGDLVDKPSIPIPSPFDMSMPPGYAPPSTPPFDPSEPVKAEKVGGSPAQFNEPKVAAPADEPKVAAPVDEPAAWSPPPAPVEEWKGKNIGENTPFETPPEGAAGTSQTLAIVALVCGALSMTICCMAGIIMGPLGVILGFIAKGKADSNPAEFGGRGLALAGLITGIIGTLIGLIFIVLQIMGGVLPSLLGAANF